MALIFSVFTSLIWNMTKILPKKKPNKPDKPGTGMQLVCHAFSPFTIAFGCGKGYGLYVNCHCKIQTCECRLIEGTGTGSSFAYGTM